MFTGLLTALVTPFSADSSSIDYDALAILVEKQIEQGVDGLVILGTTGEAPTISYHEKEQLIHFVVSNVAGRTKVIIGTGTNDTKTTIHNSILAETLGADGVLVVNPYYNKPTQKGLIAHFRKVADAIEIPVLLYNIPGRTSVNLLPESVEILCQHPNIAGIKAASGDLQQIKQVCSIAAENPPFYVLSGDDNLTDKIIRLGGKGVVSVASNLWPGKMKQWVDALMKGKEDTANKIRQTLAPLFEACFVETNPIPIKTLLAHKGLCEESLRLPLTTMDAKNRSYILNLIKA